MLQHVDSLDMPMLRTLLLLPLVRILRLLRWPGLTRLVLLLLLLHTLLILLVLLHLSELFGCVLLTGVAEWRLLVALLILSLRMRIRWRRSSLSSRVWSG